MKSILAKRPMISLRSKLLISFLLVVIIPTSLIGWFSYQKSAELLEQQAANAYSQALLQAGINLTYRLQEVENLSDVIFTNGELQRILKRERSGYSGIVSEEMLDDYNDLRQIIQNLENSSNIYRVRLFLLGDSLYTQENTNLFSISALDPAIHQPLMETRNHKLWKYTYVQNYLYDTRLQVISLFRVLKDMNRLDTIIGVAAVDIEERVINRVFQDISFTPNASLFVYTKEQLITSRLATELAAAPVNSLLEQIRARHSSERSFITLDGRGFLLLFQEVETTDWTIAALIPLDEISGNSKVIGDFTIVIVLLFASVAAIAAIVLAHTLTTGIRRLSAKMQHTKQVGYGELIEVRGRDEIAGLQAQYNNMITRIKELIEEVYQIKISKQAAELRALESQINPHFLYNTLDTIKWMAMKTKADSIVNVIDALSRFFRLSLNRGQEYATVEHECNHIKAYMHIQNIRFGSRVTCVYEVSDDVQHAEVLKLILQPLVENALVHGIQQKEEPSGIIIVRAYRQENCLMLEVLDDGPGITKEQAQAILAPDSKGYGARNVHQRIVLYYGSPYGLTYSSRPEGGCRVCATLPLRLPAQLHQ